MVKPPKPPLTWSVQETQWSPEQNAHWESLTTVGNGYLGLRGAPEEPFAAGPSYPGFFVAGVFDPDRDGIPELVNLTNVIATEIEFEGNPFVLKTGAVASYSRILDMKRGVLARELTYAGDCGRTQLRFERFASVVDRHLLAQMVSIVPLDWGGEVTVTFWFDPKVVNQNGPHLKLLHAEHMSRSRLLMATETLGTRIRVGHAGACSAWVRQAQPPRAEWVSEGMRLGFCFRMQLEAGQEVLCRRLVSTFTARDPDVVSVERSCLGDLRGLDGQSYGVRRRQHVRGWARRWDRSDIRIDGPPEDQQAARFAIYHLIQSCPQKTDRASIAAKGLTGEGYRGHVFWDTEIFMLPFFSLTAPAAARRLLTYRVHCLEGAREKASEYGYKGAMFAWESADTGRETCPTYVKDPKTGEPVRVSCGELEQHISSDVVYAAWNYVKHTGRRAFLSGDFLRLAVDVARFWASRVTFNPTDKDYEIHDVIGPDEYHEHIDNNAFTNFTAAWVLRTAATEVRRLTNARPGAPILRELDVSDSEVQTWQEIARRIVLPWHEDGLLLEQHQGFFDLADVDPAPLSALVSTEPENARMAKIHRAQILKQADVIMLMVLFPHAFSEEMKRRNWEYYEPRTTHDSSLSPSVHVLAACELGLSAKAYEYFRRSASIDLGDVMHNADQGLHSAAQGGTWQAIVYGFLGLTLGADGPTLTPRLPAAWDGVSTQVQLKGRWYRLTATRGAPPAVEPMPSPSARKK
jgi:trehalose/maltose hydrolase-like predicted phosphorylase